MSQKIVQVGYFTKSRRLEKKLTRWAKKLAPKILSKKSMKRFKTIKICLYKNRLEAWEWGFGYHWVANGSTIEIVICRGFRETRVAKWMIAHELAHAEQIASGKLSKSLSRARYKDHHYNWVKSPDGFKKVTGYPKFFESISVPWEVSANRTAAKALRGIR